MKAIHGGKAKNDKIDSQKIAALLRGLTRVGFFVSVDFSMNCDT
jgi:hypothetical protein